MPRECQPRLEVRPPDRRHELAAHERSRASAHPEPEPAPPSQYDNQTTTRARTSDAAAWMATAGQSSCAQLQPGHPRHVELGCMTLPKRQGAGPDAAARPGHNWIKQRNGNRKYVRERHG